MTTRERVTVEEVAADPTDCFQVTVNGDAAIESLAIHDDGTPNAWVSIKYKSGSSSSGTPKHWHSFVRVTEEEAVFLPRITFTDAEDARQTYNALMDAYLTATPETEPASRLASLAVAAHAEYTRLSAPVDTCRFCGAIEGVTSHAGGCERS